MLEFHLRRRCQHVLLDPAARRLARHFSPNQVTLLSLIFGLMTFPALVLGWVYSAILCLVISGYLDALDGTVARMTGRATPFGAVLDILCDRLVEIAVVLGLYSIDPASRGWACLIMLASILVIITGFLLAGIFVKNDSHKSFNYTPGLMERPEAFIFFAAMMLMPGYMTWLAVIFSLLVLYTAARRILDTKRLLEAP